MTAPRLNDPMKSVGRSTLNDALKYGSIRVLYTYMKEFVCRDNG